MGGASFGDRGQVGDQGVLPEFNGVWDDLQGPVAQGLGNAALTYEQYRAAPFKCYFLRSGQSDELNYVFQTRHRWQYTTPMILHVHYTGMSTWAAADLTKNVYFSLAWCWVASMTEVPDAADWTTSNVTMPVAKANQFKDWIFDLATVSPAAGCKGSSILRVQLIRLGANVLDTYTDNKVGGTGAANIALWDVDCHFQADKGGSAAAIP